MPSSSDASFSLVFRISPLIRITLLGLYLALTLPLPILSQVTAAPIPHPWLAVGLGIGWVGLYGILSERVIVDDHGIQVTYPTWVPGFVRSGWSLRWDQIKGLQARTTGQGGLVYYCITESGAGYLLPMRMAGFKKFVEAIQQKTGIDTQDVYPLSQPWMYIILLGLTGLLLLIDLWVIGTAMSLGQVG